MSGGTRSLYGEGRPEDWSQWGLWMVGGGLGPVGSLYGEGELGPVGSLYGEGGLGPVGSLYGEEGPCMVKGVPVCPPCKQTNRMTDWQTDIIENVTFPQNQFATML